MEFRKFGSRYLVRIDRGEEIVAILRAFCQKEGIALGTIHGLGATNRATIGLFETSTKKYHPRELSGDMEIAPLFGIITTMNGETYLHIHANLCDRENRSLGGHLSSAVVSATFEAVVDAIEGSADRKFSDEIGLNLIDFRGSKNIQTHLKKS